VLALDGQMSAVVPEHRLVELLADLDVMAAELGR
jgi:hypothetical protein